MSTADKESKANSFMSCLLKNTQNDERTEREQIWLEIRYLEETSNMIDAIQRRDNANLPQVRKLRDIHNVVEQNGNIDEFRRFYVFCENLLALAQTEM